MAFISRQGVLGTFSADAHRMFGDNWWAMDVFFIYFFLVYNSIIRLLLDSVNI